MAWMLGTCCCTTGCTSSSCIHNRWLLRMNSRLFFESNHDSFQPGGEKRKETKTWYFKAGYVLHCFVVKLALKYAEPLGKKSSCWKEYQSHNRTTNTRTPISSFSYLPTHQHSTPSRFVFLFLFLSLGVPADLSVISHLQEVSVFSP